MPRDIGFIALSSDLRSHDGLSWRIIRISAKAIAHITHYPPMIEKRPPRVGLTVEGAREIDCAGNNALYRATRTRSLKEFIPTGRGTSRADRILSAVSLSILPTNLSSSVGEERDRPTVKAVRIARGSLGLLSRYTRSRGSMLLRAQKISLPHPISSVRRSNPV